MSDAGLSPGVARYVAAAQEAQRRRNEEIARMRRCRFDTIAVHGLYTMSESLDYNQGSIIEPIYMASSQAYRDSDEMEAALAYLVPTWCYSRIANPSLFYFENVLALLEGYGFDGETSCCATSSGMAAIHSATEPFLSIGAGGAGRPMNFVATCQVYGGTFQQFAVRKDREKGVECRWVVRSTDLEEWESKIDENTRFLYGELPSNPGQAFFDLAAVAEIAHRHGLPLIIDNTVGSPALLRPLCHGADVVIQSVTKTLTSSGFGIAGAVIARKNLTCRFAPEELKADFPMYIKALPNRDNGPNLSPMNAILSLNDMRTLRSKVDLFSRNTMRVAEFLGGHPQIEKVDYLGLPAHPLHALASRYLFLVDAEHDPEYGRPINRYGHLMSLRVKGGAAATRRVFDAFQRIWRATDLGRVKSVATIPAISTHQQQGEEGRRLADVPPNLIRLCVGGEHPDDVIADLDQALAAITGKVTVSVPAAFSVGGASREVPGR
ncbi:MAG: O-acetylhomoserine aminocarboxypropyltransferase/cysteine synthase [Candidatus Eisenbacteria bacterium]|uniref:O-acetylhomoserine aminocarboxypropyltransferase/cysteine synthase n=1 Tax=Eiseniibacteriota bacterium TaxID=2212470 RepID=A0A937X688_UNCEI|nr:O-acetylhomoserine aminocarboxypropyltransferase/cysteine synthase [Candidatus Eisenbacteria bacterium]